MHSTNFQSLSAQAMQLQRVIWFALNGSILLYLVIPFIVPPMGETSSWQSMELLFYLFGFVAAASCFALRQYFFSKDSIRSRLATPVTAESLAATQARPGEDTSEKLEQLKELDDYELRLLSLLRWSLMPNIICWALIESIAVLGLVFSLLSGQASNVVPFVVIALLLNLQCFPRLDRLSEQAKMSRI